MRETYDEIDLRIIHALQIAPRAPWRRLAGPLEISTATLTRRWSDITRRGDARITAYANPRRIGGAAMLEVSCTPSAVEEVAAAIARARQAATVREMSGSADLLVSVRTRSVAEAAAFIRGLRNLSGVQRIQSNVVTRLFATAAQWRLNALTPAQIRAVHALAPTPPREPPRPLAELDERIVRALGRDGRASATLLAQELGISLNTVRRRLQPLFESGTVEIRCDISPAVAEREALAAFWLRVPPERLIATAQAMTNAPSIRAVFTLTGPCNLFLVAWLRHPSELPDFETQLVRLAPGIIVGDRAVQLRVLKLAGRLLGDDGRVTEVIPMDY
ncbi:Lrp/AsnC family transcriptional regulator [Microbacterium sp. No. 7]|uniref:Lrp/AsnC family transcriptional regulator n=1 Tax=Microbacterium sp. No. 7 TaxID=1714373 RepID=UPI0006D08797|nr:Lrp/AsnC family transcriptional regulator [Microbacterium sp. No. 7]ALJ20353.1 hypothetical protein AOA12_10690 [Microbacterium sp. No. 7]